MKLKNYWFLIIFFLVFIGFFFRQIFLSEVFYCCDNLLINIPAKIYWAQSILAGKFPIDNPYLFSGTHFLADINLSPLYPGNILFLLIQPFRAVTLLMLIHIVLLGIGMIWITKLLGYEKNQRLLTTLVFVFSGTILGYTGNLPMMQVVSWLPWVFGSWIVYCQKPSKSSIFTIVLTSVLQILAGHIQLTFYTFLFSFLYGFLFSSGNLKKKIWSIGLITGIIFLVASVQLVPFIEFAIHTTRIGKGFAYASFGGLPLGALIRFIVPSIVGNLQQGTDWWQGGSVNGYIGLVPLLLTIVAFVDRKKEDYFFIIIGCLTFLAAFGSTLPIFPLIYYIIPGISLFRVPSHFLLISTFCFSILAGRGFESFLSLPQSKKRSLGHVLFICSCLVICVWGIGILGGSEYLHELIRQINNSKLQSKLLLFGTNGLNLLFGDISRNILLIGIELFVLDLCLRYSRKIAWILVLGIIVLDLSIFSTRAILTVPISTVTSWENEQKNLVSEMSKIIDPRYLTYVHPSLYPSPYKRVFGTSWMEDEIHWQFQSFRPNFLMNYQIPMVDGYASMIDGRYQQLFGVAASDPTGVSIPDSSTDILQQLGVRYILFPKSTSELGEKNFLKEHLSLLWESEHFDIYENPTTKLPTIFEKESMQVVNGGIVLSLVGMILFMILPMQ